MKRVFLPLILCAIASVAIAQEEKESYFGIKAGVNLSQITFDPAVDGLEIQNRPGFAGGIYYNIAFSKKFSIQPEVLYSAMGAELINKDGQGIFKIDYVSVPLLLKFTPSWRFGIFVGPQFDFLTKAEYRETVQTSDLNDMDIAATGGVEFWVSRNIGLYGRYSKGFENVNENYPQLPLFQGPLLNEFTNWGIQVGVTIGFRPKLKPKDGDGDGIVDKNDKCPTTPGVAKYEGCPVPDTDGDGVNDDDDRCVNQPGLAKYNGCPVPDTDGDGVNDEADRCVNQPGLAKYNGCPVPDTDGDGINDEEDKCPNEKGEAKYNGCPVPDRDGDSINDEEDRCPDHPGIAEMKGCPKPDYKAQGVTFGSNSAKLTDKGKKELDRLYDFMIQYPELNIVLIGYTDSTGSDKINNPLSEKRAQSSKDYLVSKGIDESRLTVEGRGSADPIMDNKTKEGRAQNRRIELRVL